VDGPQREFITERYLELTAGERPTPCPDGQAGCSVCSVSTIPAKRGTYTAAPRWTNKVGIGWVCPACDGSIAVARDWVSVDRLGNSRAQPAIIDAALAEAIEETQGVVVPTDLWAGLAARAGVKPDPAGQAKRFGHVDMLSIVAWVQQVEAKRAAEAAKDELPPIRTTAAVAGV
jgi:hypothetical protein